MLNFNNFRRLLAAFFMVAALAPGGAAAKDANVFVYHRFGDARYPSTNISLDDFRQQLEYLKAEHFQVLALSEVIELIRDGSPIPERTAVLTIDDGYTSVLEGAIPLLREYGYPATLFVATDSVGHPGYLTWEQLQEVRAAGVEIGNHSASHSHLVNRRPDENLGQWLGRVRSDIVRAQKAIKEHLGASSNLFAYPYGEFTPEITEIIQELGFDGAALQKSGVFTPGADVFTIPRFPMGGPYATFEGFREKLHMKGLAVEAEMPESPLVSGENPPLLTLVIDPAGGADLNRLTCYVDGQPQGKILADPENPGIFRVRAMEPLQGRRSKYTITAPGQKGGWYWYSKQWIRPEVSER